MGPLRVAFYLLVPGILLLLRIADEVSMSGHLSTP